ncbi:MAG: hypothetical protein U1E89_23955 [Burkholderiaceae bacterium]
METLLLTLGRISGLAGAAVFAAAIAMRLAGVYWIGGFQVGTMLQASVAAMVLGCFCLLMALAGRIGDRGL